MRIVRPPRSRKAARRVNPASSGVLDPLVPLYLLRMLVDAGGHKLFLMSNGFRDDTIAEELGVIELAESESFSRPEALKALRARLAQAERSAAKTRPRSFLRENLRWLKASLGLSQVECEVLGFVVLLRHDSLVESAGDYLGISSESQLIHTLSRVLRLPRNKVQDAISPSGRLARSGLLAVDRGGHFPLRMKLETLPGVSDLMLSPHKDPFSMFAANLSRGPRSRLVADDYAHVAEDLQLLKSYLGHASDARQAGVNVLLYGPPGTGKTEFVRMMAAELGSELFEISVARPDGAPLPAGSRIGAYRLSQELLGASARCLVLFDEIEDVFAAESGRGIEREFSNTGRDGQKGWLNRLLESNPVPAFWVSNRVDHIDRAILRRFDYVMELGLPPRQVRKTMLAARLDRVAVSERWIERTAANDAISPAQIERAAKVVIAAAAGSGGDVIEAALDRVLGNALEVQGMPRLQPCPDSDAIPYSLEHLNADCDLEQVIGGIRKTGGARMCLYGPPGTGKTGFGRYLAERLGKPLLVKRASDLLGSYVGMTERNIAGMFRQARAEGAVLLLDEADSFLRDRAEARNAWEITMVNELLTQLEQYEGVIVLSTNLETALDAASLRRFDFKLRFGPLRDDQLWPLFQELAAALLPEAPDASWQKLMRSLLGLTPGDFATVRRQAQLSPVADCEDLYRRLLQEKRVVRDRESRPIGFVHAAGQ